MDDVSGRLRDETRLVFPDPSLMNELREITAELYPSRRSAGWHPENNLEDELVWLGRS